MTATIRHPSENALPPALALTDECSLCGVVRAHIAAKACGLKLVVGTEVKLVDGPRVVFLATDREGYGHLSALITRARRRATKGSYRLERADLGAGLEHCLALLIPPPELPVEHLPRFEAEIAWAPPAISRSALDRRGAAARWRRS